MIKQMGLGKLGKPGNIHAMKFRYEIISKHFIPEIVVKTYVDHVSKQINITVRDAILEDSIFDSLKWIDQLPSYDDTDETHSFTLVTYDGVGNKLYETEFKGLKLHGHNVDFDYNNNEEVHRNLTLHYTSSNTKILTKLKEPDNNFNWKISISDKNNNLIVQNQKIPNIKRPSNTTKNWDQLEFNLSIKELLKYIDLLDSDDNTITLYLIQNNKILEYWHLFNATITMHENMLIKINYKKAIYYPMPNKYDFEIIESDL